METRYGLKFILLDKSKISEFTGYDRRVALCHIANCGHIIIDEEYELPIDNEYDLDEIYKMIEKNEH